MWGEGKPRTTLARAHAFLRAALPWRQLSHALQLQRRAAPPTHYGLELVCARPGGIRLLRHALPLAGAEPHSRRAGHCAEHLLGDCVLQGPNAAKYWSHAQLLSGHPVPVRLLGPSSPTGQPLVRAAHWHSVAGTKRVVDVATGACLSTVHLCAGVLLQSMGQAWQHVMHRARQAEQNNQHLAGTEKKMEGH